MKHRLLLGLVLLFFIFTPVVKAADLNYPYSRINLNLPPSEDPFPGFGSFFSTISKGTKSVLWNPATLGKINISEASLTLATASGNYDLSKTTKFNEMGGTFEVGAGSTTGKAPMSYAVFFRPVSAVTGIGTTTKEVEMKSNLNYSTTVTGVNFSAAQKINDWLVFGLASNNPFEGDIFLGGSFPTTARMELNLKGKSLGDMQITSDGKIKFSFSSGGTTSTLETVSPVWSGFLSQEATFPIVNVSAISDNLKIQSPYVGTIASHLGSFYAGLNILPISASANLDNEIQTVITSDVSDQFIYTPNFDPTNATEGSSWLTDPDKYGKSAGYSRKQIILPSGNVVAGGKYRGVYNGSTSRMDFGMLYDPTDWFTLGLAMENLSGSSLTLQGTGLASYANYRDINTAEANNLLQPGADSSWAPFSDRWIMAKTDASLADEKTYSLPRKLRYGFAFKRPFLIAIDFEQNQSPITIPGTTDATAINVSNLNFMRLGLESRFFSFPLVARLGLTFLLKPTISGADTATQNSINNYFKFGGLPLKLDLGTTLDLWGYEIADSFGFNMLPYLNLLQLDISNLDFTKTASVNLSVKKENWEVNFLSQFDLLSTAATYNNKSIPSSGKKSFEFSDLKFVQSIGMTYRF